MVVVNKLRISIAGCGFVGLVTAVSLASRGYKVIGTTIVKEHVDLINNGKPPFYEKNLDDILKSAVDSGNLRVTLDNRDAIMNSDVTFISVGTPMREDKSIDLTYIDTVSKEIGEALSEKSTYHLVVDRSTVIPGTTKDVIGKKIEKYSQKKMGDDFGLCMQPEFLREGEAVYDTFHPDRVIIGQYDTKSGDLLENLWREFYGTDTPKVVRMNIESAEMVKYANNSFLATKISFANEFANLCEKVPGLDVTEVMQGIGMDQRINRKFLNAGAGFGGSCFPKDVNAIKAFADKLGYPPQLLASVLSVNADQALHVANVVKTKLKSLEGKKISILGLSFKPDTDDMREAPSIKIIEALAKQKAKISAYDPYAEKNAKEAIKEKVEYSKSIEDCVRDSYCAIIVTEWEEFKKLTPESFINLMKEPCIVDARRVYDKNLFSQKLDYYAIGLGKFQSL